MSYGAEGEHTSRQIINIDCRNVGTQYSRPQDEVSEEVKRSETSNQDNSVNKERRQNKTSRNKEAKMGDFDNWDVTFDNQMQKWPLRGSSNPVYGLIWLKNPKSSLKLSIYYSAVRLMTIQGQLLEISRCYDEFSEMRI